MNEQNKQEDRTSQTQGGPGEKYRDPMEDLPQKKEEDKKNRKKNGK